MATDATVTNRKQEKWNKTQQQEWPHQNWNKMRWNWNILYKSYLDPHAKTAEKENGLRLHKMFMLLVLYVDVEPVIDKLPFVFDLDALGQSVSLSINLPFIHSVRLFYIVWIFAKAILVGIPMKKKKKNNNIDDDNNKNNQTNKKHTNTGK